MCFDFLYKFFFEILLFIRRTEQDIIINVHRISCKVPPILVRFQWNMKLSTDFRIIFNYQISRKFVQWEPSCCMRTDMKKVIVPFRNVTRAPKMLKLYLYTPWRHQKRAWLALLISDLLPVSGERSTWSPGCFTPGRDTDTHWIGGLGGLTAGLDGLDERSVAPVGITMPDHPSRSLVTIPTELSQFK